MASLKFVLNSNKQKKNGKSPIYLRIIENRKARYLSTKIYIEEKYWNEKKERVRSSHTQYNLLNGELERIYSDALKARNKLNQVGKSSAQNIKEIVKNDFGSNFYSFSKPIIDDFNLWQRKKYLSYSLKNDLMIQLDPN